MVNRIGIINNGIVVYVDPYMDDNILYQGYKGGEGTKFIVANTKTANIIYNNFVRKQRQLKLDKLKWKSH